LGKNLKNKDHMESQEVDDTDINVNHKGKEPDLPELDTA
jgi:hypothetical protein